MNLSPNFRDRMLIGVNHALPLRLFVSLTHNRPRRALEVARSVSERSVEAASTMSDSFSGPKGKRNTPRCRQ